MSREEKLRAIADTIQGWLDFQNREHARDAQLQATPPLSDRTHFMSPPVWPTRGTLKNWIKVLNGEGDGKSER